MSDDPEATRYGRPGDAFPGTSQNIMASFGRDEFRSTPRKKSWPLLVSPLLIALGVGIAILIWR